MERAVIVEEREHEYSWLVDRECRAIIWGRIIRTNFANIHHIRLVILRLGWPPIKLISAWRDTNLDGDL